jgi:putative effector of murein hydrolase
VGVPLLRVLGVRSRLATGLALGAAAHGLGTARAAHEGDVEGASSGMAMGVVGVLTALLAPLVLSLVQRIG